MKKYRYVLNSISTNYQITIIKDDRLEYLVKSSEAVFEFNSITLVVALKLKVKLITAYFIKIWSQCYLIIILMYWIEN